LSGYRVTSLSRPQLGFLPRARRRESPLDSREVSGLPLSRPRFDVPVSRSTARRLRVPVYGV